MAGLKNWNLTRGILGVGVRSEHWTIICLFIVQWVGGWHWNFHNTWPHKARVNTISLFSAISDEFDTKFDWFLKKLEFDFLFDPGSKGSDLRVTFQFIQCLTTLGKTKCHIFIQRNFLINLKPNLTAVEKMEFDLYLTPGNPQKGRVGSGLRVTFQFV